MWANKWRMFANNETNTETYNYAVQEQSNILFFGFFSKSSSSVFQSSPALKHLQCFFMYIGAEDAISVESFHYE